MLKYAIVAVGSALLAGLGVWLLLPAPPIPSAREAPAPAARIVLSAKRSAPIQEAALADCKRALLQQRAELRFVREQAARTVEDGHILIDDEDGIAPPDTGERSAAAPAPGEDPATDPTSPRQRQRAAAEKVRDAIVERLGITEDEEKIVKDLVCPQRENLRGLYLDFADGRIEAEALLEALAQERAVSGEGLQRALGKRRFRHLRRVGAIGLLAPRLCKRP